MKHVALVLSAAGLLTTHISAADRSRPNVILIMADDMGYGDVSCYGDAGYQTRHVDRLAATGLRFTDFHSNGNVCSPTRAALLTGRYQHRAGIPGVLTARGHRHQGLHVHETTFAEALQKSGYRTALFGKWHLGYATKYNPVRHGFDAFRGYVSGNVDYFSHIDQTGVYDWWSDDQLIQEPGYTTHLITDHAVRFIEENRDQPFCLYLAHETPHYPYQGPRDSADRTVGGSFDNHGSRPDRKAAYREMMLELDGGIGRVIATLERLELDRKTFVLLFSDNGATRLGNNGPLRGTKGTNWEGGHRVPAIAWWPGRIDSGGVCSETVMTMDLMPTVLALTGVNLPEGHRLDGVDLTPQLLDGKALAQRTLYWHRDGRSAVRRGPWKLVVNPRGDDGFVGLYDLDRDITEQRNRAQEHPDRTKELQAALTSWLDDVSSTATRQPID